MRTAIILKKSWTVDAAKALLNSFPFPIYPTETIVFVTVVPMLAPIIIGTAPPIERAPVLAIVTMIDVVVEELWNSVVHNIPINKATKGLLVAVRTVFAKSPPKPLMPDDNPPIPTRNRYKQKNTISYQKQLNKKKQNI